MHTQKLLWGDDFLIYLLSVVFKIGSDRKIYNIMGQSFSCLARNYPLMLHVLLTWLPKNGTKCHSLLPKLLVVIIQQTLNYDLSKLLEFVYVTILLHLYLQDYLCAFSDWLNFKVLALVFIFCFMFHLL